MPFRANVTMPTSRQSGLLCAGPLPVVVLKSVALRLTED
jgi:hypothetical protein